jgi:hypothetical protein
MFFTILRCVGEAVGHQGLAASATSYRWNPPSTVCRLPDQIHEQLSEHKKQAPSCYRSLQG